MFEEYIPRDNPRRVFIRELFDWVEAVMLGVVCVVLLFTFVIRTAGVEGESMQPILYDQDKLLITRLGEPLRQRDIVVSTKPNRTGTTLVKRVIALEGQAIDINFETGEVIVDGRLLNENLYIKEPININSRRSDSITFPAVVPEGHVFVMGDNRNNSWDSRSSEIGMIDQRHILGKVLYRVAPYEERGKRPLRVP
jgi:signal peptidase I